MDELPLEILEIIAEDEQTYRGLLAIPYFARSVRPSKRIDFMIKFGHSIYIDKCKIIWTRNKYHRLNRPAVEWENGDKEWWVNGKRHRSDGPAIKYVNGDKEWWVNGKRHRLDKPAVDYISGYRWWYVDGRLHRLDGPAIEYANGDKSWYIDDKCLSEERFKQLTQN